VIRSFNKCSSSSKKIYLLLVIITLFPFCTRIIYGDGINGDVLRDMMLQIALVNFFAFELRTNTGEKLKIVDLVLSLFVVINFCSILFYPDGIYSVLTQDGQRYTNYWFLGTKNYMIRTLTPAIVINVLVSYFYKGKLTIRNLIIYIISFISVLLTGSSTGIIMILFLGIGLLALPLMKNLKLFNPLVIFLGYIVLSITIVGFGIQDIFSNYLEELFDKDSTLSGRIFVWEYSLFRIQESPFIGFGYHLGEQWHDVLGFTFSKNFYASHPHNYLLYLMLQGGLLYLSLFIILFYFITTNSKRLYGNREYALLSLMCFVFFIGGISESLTNAPLMFPLIGLFGIYMDKEIREKKSIITIDRGVVKNKINFIRN
jgi:O-antigen ligase